MRYDLIIMQIKYEEIQKQLMRSEEHIKERDK